MVSHRARTFLHVKVFSSANTNVEALSTSDVDTGFVATFTHTSDDKSKTNTSKVTSSLTVTSVYNPPTSVSSPNVNSNSRARHQSPTTPDLPNKQFVPTRFHPVPVFLSTEDGQRVWNKGDVVAAESTPSLVKSPDTVKSGKIKTSPVLQSPAAA